MVLIMVKKIFKTLLECCFSIGLIYSLASVPTSASSSSGINIHYSGSDGDMLDAGDSVRIFLTPGDVKIGYRDDHSNCIAIAEGCLAPNASASMGIWQSYQNGRWSRNFDALPLIADFRYLDKSTVRGQLEWLKSKSGNGTLRTMVIKDGTSVRFWGDPTSDTEELVGWRERVGRIRCVDSHATK